MNIFLSSNFIRKHKKLTKKNPQLNKLIVEKLKLFDADPFHPSLRPHKIFSKEIIEWSISITGDIRIILQKIGNDVILTDLGTHDEVY